MSPLRSAPRLRRTVPVALLVAVLAACGSTVPIEQQAGSTALDQTSGVVPGEQQATAGDPAGGDALAPAEQPAGASGGAGAGDAAQGPAAPAAGGGKAPSGAVRGQAPAASAPAATTEGDQAAPDVKDTAPLKVGVFYLSGGNQVISNAFPGSSVSFGDGRREAQAIIDDINARGAAGGRKLVPHFIKVEATDNDANRQRACLGAVQDARPVALFAVFNLSQGLARCVEQTKTLMIDVALGAGDEGLYAQGKGLVFSPSQLTRDAEQELVLANARKEGKLPAGKPVGILAQSDDPMFLRVSRNTIQPALKRYGVPYIEQTISSGADSSGMNAAVLKFKSSGVDTVVFSIGSGGIPAVLFMQAAEQQQFRPSYLMGDSTNTNFVGSQAPKAQIKRISGAGTYPLANVRADQYPSPPAEKKCLDLLNKEVGGYGNRYSSLTGTLYCEIIQSFAYVASRVPGRLTSASWAQAYAAAGSGYAPVTTFSTRFSPGRPDGASSFRSLGYGSSCGCITYTSPTRPLP